MATGSGSSSLQGFSVATLEKRLRELNSTLQSIQSVSQWLIHYRKNAKTVVSIWYKEIQKGNSNRKLTLLYLANDIIQNARKKGQEYHLQFTKVLPRVLQIVTKSKDSSLIKSVERVINVWEERQVFESVTLVRFKAVLVSGSMNSKRRTKSESDVKHAAAMSKQVRKESQESSPEEGPNGRKPPEPEELIKRMLAIDGERSVTADMATRERIANFPPEIHNPDAIEKIKDKAVLDGLSLKVEEASKMLMEYNQRLEAELKERVEIQEMLDVFVWQQKTLLKKAKKYLKEYQSKLEKISMVREELKSHLANLPDLSKLPQGQMKQLEPLPSVGDLFN